MEYNGEVITQEEAERRGRIYDKNPHELTYLFEINEEQVIDASRHGNKSKYINYNKNNPNVFQKKILVNGEHKIGLFAKQKMFAGQELTYDYNFKQGNVPSWAKKL